jgi:hypothetical protein
MAIVLAALLAHAVAAVLELPLELLGTLDQRRIPEASGIVKSRRYPEIFWVHNDSGNPPLLFAIRRDGRIVREFRVEVPNIDWEDIAIDDQGHLYLGDIGNNFGLLPIRVIYRLDEPDPAGKEDRPLRPSAAAFYAFPAKEQFDAEGLVYDRGNAMLVAKYLDGREAGLFTVSLENPSPLLKPGHPRSIGLLPGFTEAATGAALSDNRDLLAVCASDVTRVYQREGAARWRLYSEVRYPARPIEGIAWDGRDLVLVAEGGGLYRLAETTWSPHRRDAGTRPPKSSAPNPPARRPGRLRTEP